MRGVLGEQDPMWNKTL